MEMEGQCQSSDVARKIERLKDRRASVHWQQKEAGKYVAPLLSLAGNAVTKDMGKAQVHSDWFSLIFFWFLFLVFGGSGGKRFRSW